MQERHNSIANTLELHLSCTSPLTWSSSSKLLTMDTPMACLGGWDIKCLLWIQSRIIHSTIVVLCCIQTVYIILDCVNINIWQHLEDNLPVFLVALPGSGAKEFIDLARWHPACDLHKHHQELVLTDGGLVAWRTRDESDGLGLKISKWYQTSWSTLVQVMACRL